MVITRTDDYHLIGRPATLVPFFSILLRTVYDINGKIEGKQLLQLIRRFYHAVPFTPRFSEMTAWSTVLRSSTLYGFTTTPLKPYSR